MKPLHPHSSNIPEQQDNEGAGPGDEREANEKQERDKNAQLSSLEQVHALFNIGQHALWMWTYWGVSTC